MPERYPSGGQFELAYGSQRAVVVEVGAGLRLYEDNGRPVLQDFPLSAMCDGSRGMPLIPWPNRIADGRYQFDGVEYQLPLTEPERNNATHGLLRWRSWEARKHQPHLVAMGTTLYPSPGYPFCLDVQLIYELGLSGLQATIMATNAGREECPYACGQHPYLSAGGALIDDCTLQFEAETRILTDRQRLLPIGSEPVGDYDFSDPRPIGQLKMDDGFTNLRRDQAGKAWVRLAAPDGCTVELWLDQHFPVLQLFTGDTLKASRRRCGLAAEPMSAPANAFQTGEHLVRLKPGQTHTASWGVHLVRGKVGRSPDHGGT